MNSDSLCSLAGRYDNPSYSVPSPHRLFKNSSSSITYPMLSNQELRPVHWKKQDTISKGLLEAGLLTDILYNPETDLYVPWKIHDTWPLIPPTYSLDMFPSDLSNLAYDPSNLFTVPWKIPYDPSNQASYPWNLTFDTSNLHYLLVPVRCPLIPKIWPLIPQTCPLLPKTYLLALLRKIRLIESNSKRRYKKKTLKGLCGSCLSVLGPLPS